MLAGAFIFLVETVGDLFTVALLLRFFLQWARAAQRNPVADFVNALTNFAVLPMQYGVIPSAGQWAFVGQGWLSLVAGLAAILAFRQLGRTVALERFQLPQ